MGKKDKGKKGEESTGKGKATAPKSFDSELDALFKGTASTVPSSSTAAKASKVTTAAPPAEDSDDEDEADGTNGHLAVDEDVDNRDEELSSIDSDAVISGISEDESEGEQGVDEDTPHAAEKISEEEESDDGEIPLHETISNPSLLLNGSSRPAKRKVADREEPQSQKDTRSLFIGNLPVHLASSKTSLKALKKHLIACSPYPSVTQIESLRFRSIPFSKPTDDYEARNPDEAEEGNKKRQRSRSYKDSLGENPFQKKSFLSGSQKRKVAYINHEINDKADSVNAYVTLAHISPSAVERLKNDKQKDASHLTESALAALLAVSVNGTLFEERHLRADLVVPLLPADILETGLHTVKTADGSLLGASAGATSIDNESRKRTVFVGNLDFEAKEEELRGFFEALVTRERGSPPDVKALDFSQSDKLPLPEELEEEAEDGVKRLASWVYGVRIIRDAATQMGKGFGYVRFLDAACVDEIVAIHESEQNALAALKAGKSLNQEFRRKLRFKGRPLRLSRCKVSKGNVTSTAATLTPKRPVISVPHRDRSSGAPTPGGSSPFLRKQQQSQQQSATYDSPTRKSSSAASGAAKSTANGIATVPNPKPLHSDPLKTARNAQKRADVARQARRMEKKNKQRAERGTREEDRGDEGKIKLKMKMGKTGNKFKKLGRFGTLAMLSIVALLSLLVSPTAANNEIVNFGPIYCRAEEVGHLEDKAARQVSQGWPILTPSSQPTLFSLNPSTQKDGVWLILDLTNDGSKAEAVSSSMTTTPESLATTSFPLLSRSTPLAKDEKRTPRDEWIQRKKNTLLWTLFTKRFSFRVNWAANFPINVDASVHSARSMLKQGKITWKADDQDMETLQQDEDLIGVDIPMWPCPRLYVHIVAKEFGIRIPSQQDIDDTDRNAVWKWIFRAAEVYMGPLMSKLKDADKTAQTPIPVHLVLEPLYLGFVPQTALTLLAVLLPLLGVTYLMILPPVTAAIQNMATEHIKTE